MRAKRCKFQQSAEWQWAGEPWAVPVPAARLAQRLAQRLEQPE
jgi:hypothetical protein